MKHLWQWLTEPSAAITDAEQRRQSRLLSSLLLLTLLALALSSIGVRLLQPPTATTSWGDLLGKISVFLVSYLLSRRGYHRLAVWLFAGVSTVVLLAMALGSNTFINNPLYYLIALPFIASMFLPQRDLLLLVGIQLAAIIVLRVLTGSEVALNGLLFNLVFAPFIVVMSYYRTYLERERRAELAASERRYRQMVETTHDGVAMIDENAIIIFANPRLHQIFGYADGELNGQSMLPFIDEEARRKVPERVALRKQGISEQYTITALHKNGTPIRLQISVSPLFDDKGRFICATSMMRDITEQARAEEALRESEERFRLIAENTSDMITLHNAAEDIMYVNPASQQILGYTPAELCTFDTYALVHPADRDMIVEKLVPLQAATQTSVSATYRVRHKTNGYVWIESTIQAITDSKGSLTGMVATSRDVTQREQSNALLRASEHRLRTILQKMPIMLDAFDKNLLIAFWNDECERVTGYSAAEIVGNPKAVELLYPDPDHRTRVFENWSELGNNYRNFEERITCKDGSERIISWSNISDEVPIPGWYAWAVGIDVTEQALSKQRELVVALERDRIKLLNRFIRDISHDLRNPLSVIGTGMYIIDRKLDPAAKEKIHDNLDRINRQIEHLRRQLDNMNTMAQLYRDDYEYNRQPSDLNHVVEIVIGRLRDQAEDRQQTLTYEPDEGVVDAYIDPYEFERVVSQLLLNAINFTPHAGTITVRTHAHQTHAILEIADTGIGIAEADLPHLFEPFYRADAARDIETGGVGLGLSLVEKIVKAHDGTVEIESMPGAGSTFRVSVPAAGSPPVETVPASQRRTYS